MACSILGPCLSSINKCKTNEELKNPPRYGKLFYLLENAMEIDTNYFILFHSTTSLNLCAYNTWKKCTSKITFKGFMLNSFKA